MDGDQPRRPKVTVGITTFDDGPYILNCLVSVAAQTMPADELEVIVVDDGSTDGTTGTVASFAAQHPELSVRSFRHEHTGGPAAGRNTVIDHANGEFIFFVDGDDYLGGRACAEMYELGRHCEVIIGQFVGVRRGVPRQMFRHSRARATLQDWNVMDSLNVMKMFRTDFIRELGYRFDPTLRMAEDHPFAMNAYLHASRIAVLADVDCYYAVRHPEGEGRLHLTGIELEVDEFLAYVPATFDVIESAAVDEELRESARTQYWHRLLTLDLWREARPDREPARRERCYVRGHELAHRYATERTLTDLRPEVAFRLRLLLNPSSPLWNSYVELKS